MGKRQHNAGFAAERRAAAPETPPPHKRKRKRKPPTRRSLEQKLLLEQRYLRHAQAMGECQTRQGMIDDALRRIRAIESQIAALG